MRISSNTDDPGYQAFQTLPRRTSVLVRVNGAPIDGCLTADTKRDYAVVAQPMQRDASRSIATVAASCSSR